MQNTLFKVKEECGKYYRFKNNTFLPKIVHHLNDNETIAEFVLSHLTDNDKTLEFRSFRIEIISSFREVLR